MKANQAKAPGRLGRRPSRVLPLNRSPQDRALARLRGRLLRPLLAGTNNPRLQAGFRRAASEAESLAWLTPFPLLVLPGLLEEKIRHARLYAIRQAEVHESSPEWLSLSE
ncbi:MAG: hypothetical protein AB7J34_22390 [Limisphaerales bacterium]